MRVRGVGLVLLILCVLGGLISAFFSPAIATTLALPANAGTAQNGVPTKGQSTSTPTVVSEPMHVPTQGTGGGNVLARDTFQRANQAFWGSSSDGRQWSGDANTHKAFSIVNAAGQISGAGGSLQAILDVNSNDADLLITGSVNLFENNGDVNLGSVLRWKDADNWYKVLINGSKLQLLRDFQGTVTSLATQPFSARGGTSYSIRFRVLGSNLFAKAWPSAQAEPDKWMLRVVDTTLTGGVSGVRVLLAANTVVRITSFLETNVPMPTT